ncbi:Methyltransferase domain-containing protein [Microbulbifer donghaiensis]|uniref:Methyltransferase domain-containing protein n=1 Tax=Microbulbifer donghaiensis TaxID=494016 RepID=A0A1M5C8K7_9GAMM|nr:class I SAM-dependent methyltransferase [Microbulbifer donghaiensis]SHF51065.1 Methyltransferase domain-containing protein [Microbulbifer donghaiensis]
MSDSEFSDKKILQSWHSNAAPWIRAIDGATIASRKMVTDGAIVAAVLDHQPGSVLDVGCGEGWLSRALAASGAEVLGIDGVPELIEAARRRAGPGERYRQLSYDALAAGELRQQFDLLACNFSLIGQVSVAKLFAAAPALLRPGGHLVVQTLHPLTACGDREYRDGWRPGSWDGFSEDFSDPAPWYFRTLESWLELYRANGLEVVRLREPLHPQTGRPASLILSGRAT